MSTLVSPHESKKRAKKIARAQKVLRGNDVPLQKHMEPADAAVTCCLAICTGFSVCWVILLWAFGWFLVLLFCIAIESRKINPV
jgi:hypothetical protein